MCADFVPEDLIVLLMANAGVINATGDSAPTTWERFVAYMLQVFAVRSAAALPDPPVPRKLHRALLRAQRKKAR